MKFRRWCCDSLLSLPGVHRILFGVDGAEVNLFEKNVFLRADVALKPRCL